MSRQLSTAEFIQKAKATHGEKYNYSLSKYTRSIDKLIVICPTHGSWKITPGNHIHGNKGCPKCAHTKSGVYHKKSTAEFIDVATKTHNGKYDYSISKYTSAKDFIKIICPIHGVFEQQATLHVHRAAGCQKCGYKQRAETRRNGNNWWTYTKSKKFVNSLNLHSIKEWNKYCRSGKRPQQLPTNPKQTYSNNWEGWTAWLGYNGRTKNFLKFEDARTIAHTFNIRSFEDWVHFSTMGNRPINIPFMPKQIYKNKWISWGDWLGYENRANGNLPGVIYILQYSNLPNNVYKIGRTYRLEKRLSEHQRVNKTNIKVIETFSVPIMSLAESTAHDIALSLGKKFKYKKSTEHFEIDNINLLLMLFEKEFNNKK